MNTARPGNLYLCGMIGTGKTTVGGLVAGRLGLPFHDLDREMDRELGYSFHRLVREKGWVAFRELEYAICRRFARMSGAVIALGGGTVRYAWNMDVLRGTGRIVLLTASLAELARRVRAADRPRVNPGASLEEDLAMIWSESAEKYREAADAVIDTDGRSAVAIAAELTALAVDYMKAG
jgi:shikimate kinase